MPGITSQGFEPKPQQDIESDLASRFRAVFGATITTIAQSVFGQLISIVADRIADVWQLGLALYNASTREGAIGIQLDNVGALTGTMRLQATYTKVTLVCSGVNGTVIPAGSLVSIPDVGTQFTIDVDSAPMSGGSVTMEWHAVEAGPNAAFAGTITLIDTPVTGWASVTNPLDHSHLGTDVEDDTTFRIRQVSELRAQGASTVAALRARIQQVTGVTGVFVFENVGDSTDADGLPPHSFECVVQGGTNADVAQAIATYKPVGIATYGTSTVAAQDANGFTISIKFSRPVQLNAYVVVTLKANAASYPNNGDDLVKEAIVALQPIFGIGVDLRSSALVPAYEPNPLQPTTTGVIGVLESALPLIGTAPAPGTSTTLPVGNRQIVALDTSRITVNTTLINP